jgi:hypothetical protein
MTPMGKKRIYRVTFFNQGTVYELYARSVHQGELYGFVALEGLTFGTKSAMVIDHSEERLKAEFSGVHRVHVPLHAVVRIDEVEKQGTAKIIQLPGKGDNVASFPTPIYTPSDGSRKP